MEAVATVVALDLPNGEAQEHGKQDEDPIVRPSEDRQQGDEPASAVHDKNEADEIRPFLA